MCSRIDPAQNVAEISAAMKKAAGQGAEILFTPEMSVLLDRNKSRAAAHICDEGNDPSIAALCRAAQNNDIALSLGSMAVQAETPEKDGTGKWTNRSLFIDNQGQILARYDKIHMFDVDLPSGESWRESKVYRGGEDAVILSYGPLIVGLSICYDLRFPELYAALTGGGANLLTVPAAFTRSTGRAHWEALLRTRAIEGACFVVAAAQCGTHEDGRETYGHSMVIDPWGNILLDMNEDIAIACVDLDIEQVAAVREKLPALSHRRRIGKPRIV